MYDAAYHEDAERLDDELFQEFVEGTNLFASIKRNRQYSDIDYIGTDLKGRKCSIELKYRNCTIEQYKHIYIECSKFWKLLEKYLQFDCQPLYLNFMKNGVILFDLKQWEKEPQQLELRRIKINNKGYHENQDTYRYLLPIDKGIWFKKDETGTWKITDNKV